MPEPLVKVCGLSNLETLESAIQAGADMVGLMHVERSPRHISLPLAATLAGKTCGRVDVAVVTVDPDDALVELIARDIKPDWLQLHGCEPPERVAEIKALARTRVIKALGIREAEDVDKVALYQSVADLFILDAKPPQDATRAGGLGETFDWQLLDGVDPSTRYLLAGGLTIDNVADGLAASGAVGVDASSSMEISKGVKDPDLIYRFVHAAKSARQHATA